jgi:hypothetical protein
VPQRVGCRANDMSDDTRYPCCEDCDADGIGLPCEQPHSNRCTVRGCPGSVSVGPTKEGKQ